MLSATDSGERQMLFSQHLHYVELIKFTFGVIESVFLSFIIVSIGIGFMRVPDQSDYTVL